MTKMLPRVDIYNSLQIYFNFESVVDSSRTIFIQQLFTEVGVAGGGYLPSRGKIVSLLTKTVR